MKLFEEYPDLSDDMIRIRKMRESDAEALRAFTSNERIYRYLPSFLYELKYEDKRDVIARMDEECFAPKESILMGVYLHSDPERLVGIAEIYNYEEKKSKASVGCRLDESVWGRGIATRVLHLLRDYLTGPVGLETITAHIIRDNTASAHAAMKSGFLCKYPDLYGDWGLGEMVHTDKYVFKRKWLGAPGDGEKLPAVRVEQFVMAYGVEQDRIRAMLPDGYRSLRPVLRINAEIRDESVTYLEFNTPVEAEGRRGWLNIGFWKSSSGDDLSFEKTESATTFTLPFLVISFTGTGITGGCPAEKDNDGCFYIGNDTEFRPAEKISENKEFCDCEFKWSFHEGDAEGKSEGKTIPAFDTPQENSYGRVPLTAENAAAIPCRQVLGAYRVEFLRIRGR